MSDAWSHQSCFLWWNVELLCMARLVGWCAPNSSHRFPTQLGLCSEELPLWGKWATGGAICPAGREGFAGLMEGKWNPLLLKVPGQENCLVGWNWILQLLLLFFWGEELRTWGWYLRKQVGLLKAYNGGIGKTKVTALLGGHGAGLVGWAAGLIAGVHPAPPAHFQGAALADS